ncbi:chorismate mutase [Psychrosphaera haliotis]|uniref:Bifunctional chorismate mutase/prephenate dehydratase n=1 Tax=Psychrosphaera haliotis TaxID=555083 RepID=A0A6N8F7T4_9GAMM|nr:chorismate mutase [Psychrosphaera haliotis]
MTTNPLSDIRTQISQLDSELLTILSKRRMLAKSVAEQKIENNKPIRDLQREEQMLVDLINRGKDMQLDAYFVKQVFQTIIEDSVLHQQALLQQHLNLPAGENGVNRVAYLGSHGSYSNLACHRYFSRFPGQLKAMGCSSFLEIIEKVEHKHADYGILPIENTSSGSINDVYDLLQHTDLSIVGEITQPINHCMVSAVPTSMDKITKLYAHPQVYAQCSHFLAQFDGVEIEHCEASSAAFEAIQNDTTGTVAALGSGEGARLYGLNIIAEALANQKKNYSRFIVLANQAISVAPQVPAKSTWIMSTEQKPGALVDALLILKSHNVNMCKLESRPITGNPWEEMFYVDVEGNIRDNNLENAIEELRASTRFLKVLGCYPTEDVPPAKLTLES